MKPYEGLSQIYDGNWSVFSRLYRKFIFIAIDRWQISTSRVLDIACGTGILMSSIRKKCDMLCGLDISKEMLEKARQRLQDNSIRLYQADFCDFSFDEPFDLVIMCFDSINYIDSVKKLPLLLSCVRNSMKTNGYFIFDFLNEQHFINLHKQPETEGIIQGIRYTNCMIYDDKNKTFLSRFIFNNDLCQCEEHREIPVELDEMKTYLNDSGFELCGVFANFGKEDIDNDTTRFFCIAKLC